jgi:hypothetical protein
MKISTLHLDAATKEYLAQSTVKRIQTIIFCINYLVPFYIRQTHLWCQVRTVLTYSKGRCGVQERVLEDGMRGPLEYWWSSLSGLLLHEYAQFENSSAQKHFSICVIF